MAEARRAGPRHEHGWHSAPRPRCGRGRAGSVRGGDPDSVRGWPVLDDPVLVDAARPRAGAARDSQRPLPAAGPGERLWVLDVPVRDAGRRRHLAPGRQDPPVRRARPARAPRAVRPGALHARSVHREHPQPRRSDAQPRADRRARAPEDPVRGGRRDRGARRGGRTAVPARRRARRGQDDRRGPRGDGGGRPPRCATGARRGRPARRDHDRPLVPHDHGAGATAVWSGS